jgi:hypothetical protein
MAQLGRPGLSWKEKAELWKRWKQGESLSDIARALNKGGGSIFGLLRLRGGNRSGRSLAISGRAKQRGTRRDLPRRSSRPFDTDNR